MDRKWLSAGMIFWNFFFPLLHAVLVPTDLHLLFCGLRNSWVESERTHSTFLFVVLSLRPPKRRESSPTLQKITSKNLYFHLQTRINYQKDWSQSDLSVGNQNKCQKQKSVEVSRVLLWAHRLEMQEQRQTDGSFWGIHLICLCDNQNAYFNLIGRSTLASWISESESPKTVKVKLPPPRAPSRLGNEVTKSIHLRSNHQQPLLLQAVPASWFNLLD
jgi:hypothetical protein